jgi:hypothetical protein
MMAARPQTLYGIADSPVGLAAWPLDHNDADGQPAAAAVSALDRTASATGELTFDEILDNITLYWNTNTGVSASRQLLGIQGWLLPRQGCLHPGCRDLLGRKLESIGFRVASMGSFFELIVFERRLTYVHHDGVELEGTPLLQHLERPVPRPQRRVRIPPLQLFFEDLLLMTGKPTGAASRSEHGSGGPLLHGIRGRLSTPRGRGQEGGRAARSRQIPHRANRPSSGQPCFRRSSGSPAAMTGTWRQLPPPSPLLPSEPPLSLFVESLGSTSR